MTVSAATLPGRNTVLLGAIALVIAVLLAVTVVGAPIGLGLMLVVTLWLIYRIARGWIRLLDRQPMYV